ncbi:Innexin unc-9 [Schistosoma japonicum]|uniref:Innexin n=1 Tax=Schistosoma japonicum TaxID=6182 RepID=A0A4Z2DC22_SCHJA|nr:Innexin unc-9 [Schistosoma japonicum]
MCIRDHRKTGGHEYRRHTAGHIHSSDSHPRTFSGGATHSEVGEGGVGGLVGDSHGGHSFGGHDQGGVMDATFIWKLTKLGRIGSSRLRFDDDFADRLNYQYTGVLMFLFIGLIGIRQYVGKPIQCWIPQEFTRGWEEYAENYCWVSNTYFAPLQHSLPPAPDREMLLIGYYQWAPIVMAIQAMLFYLPCLIWRLFMAQSGFNVRRILQMSCDSNVLLPEHTMKNVRFIARYMEGCIYRQRDYRKRKLSTVLGFSPTSYTGLGQSPHVHVHQHYSPAYHQHPHLHHHPPVPPPPHSHTQSPPYMPTSHFHQLSTVNSRQSPIGGDENRYSNDHQDKIRHSFSIDDNGKKNKKRLPSVTEEATTISATMETMNSRSGIGGGDYHPILGRLKIDDSHTQQQNSPININTTSSYRSTTLPTAYKSQDKSLHHLHKRHFHYCCSCSCCCGKRQGNFLVVLYFFTKFLYLTNIIGQLFMMEKFVGNDSTFYGFRVLYDLLKGREWFHSGNFPRVTFCDFEAKKLGKNHKYTLQCVLPLNMFLEKIYIFLWFWHCMVGIITLSSFIIWFYRMGSSKCRIKFIRKYLKIMSVMRDTDKAATSKFVENYLRSDGVFLIRLISINVGDLMAGDLTFYHGETNDLIVGATAPSRYPNKNHSPTAPPGQVTTTTNVTTLSGTHINNTTNHSSSNNDDSIV